MELRTTRKVPFDENGTAYGNGVIFFSAAEIAHELKPLAAESARSYS